MPSPTSPLGSSFEVILNMTDDLTLAASQANTNLVVGLSGLSGGKTLVLPAISQMVACQNPFIRVVNKSSSGGTITISKNSADSTIIGQVTCLVATGVTFFHNGLNQWYGI